MLLRDLEPLGVTWLSDTNPRQKTDDNGCCFGWASRYKMKENGAEFWAADEYNKIQIVEIDERAKNIYMICRSTGKITWALNFKKLEDVHERIHKGELD